jgi:hypothetical protein
MGGGICVCLQTTISWYKPAKYCQLFFLLWVKPISWRCVGDILSEKKKWENETCECLKWLKNAKLENPEDALVIWPGQVKRKNDTATVEVIKEQAKVCRQYMSVANFIHKNWYVFAPKNEIIVKMNKPTV